MRQYKCKSITAQDVEDYIRKNQPVTSRQVLSDLLIKSQTFDNRCMIIENGGTLLALDGKEYSIYEKSNTNYK